MNTFGRNSHSNVCLSSSGSSPISLTSSFEKMTSKWSVHHYIFATDRSVALLYTAVSPWRILRGSID